MAEQTRRPLFHANASNIRGSYWRGSTSSLSIPEDAILTESGLVIKTEGSEPLLTES